LMRVSVVRMATTITENLAVINSRVADTYQAAGSSRAVNPPRLVAVSKTKPKEAVIEAYKAGQRVFGENYIQELVEKSLDSELQAECPDIQWHFIGNCQTNKVKDLVKAEKLTIVETITSTKLAGELNKRLAKKEPAGTKISVFIQVNTSGEANKNGLEPKEAVAAAEYIQQSCPNLNLCGLMTIGDLGNSEAASAKGDNPDFRTLVETRGAVAAALGKEETDLELSMGMSKDYEEAIKMGSTNVRVGSSIFGARSYPASASAGASASAPASASASRGVENSGGVVGGGQTPIEAHSSANTQNIVA